MNHNQQYLQNERVKLAWDTYQKTVVLNDWIRGPVHPKQVEFLLHTYTKELFYGGAGGGGKSHAMLFAALQYVDVPGYSAIIFRRRYTDLALPEAIMSKAVEYLRGSPAVWNKTDKQFRFPSGATLNFGYMESVEDRFRYRGGEYQFIGFDELTDFTDLQYLYLFSRLRRKKNLHHHSLPLRVRSASNPGGRGHEWVRRRFVDHETRWPGAVFIPATMHDNPSLDVAGYLDSLSYTDPITRSQIEKGDWNGIEGGRFLREWFKHRHYRWIDGHTQIRYDVDGQNRWIFDPMKLPASRRFITIDPAASEKSTADYTVISVWCLSPRNELVWLACYRFQKEIPEILFEINKAVNRWRPGMVGIEAVAANSAVLKFCQRSKAPVMNAIGLNPMGNDKLVRATPAMNRAKEGMILVPENGRGDFAYDDAMSEIYRFTGDDKKDSHDDVVDTVSYAVELMPAIGSGTFVPIFGDTSINPAAALTEEKIVPIINPGSNKTRRG